MTVRMTIVVDPLLELGMTLVEGELATVALRYGEPVQCKSCGHILDFSEPARYQVADDESPTSVFLRCDATALGSVLASTNALIAPSRCQLQYNRDRSPQATGRREATWLNRLVPC